MKTIFIAYDQAYNMEVADALQTLGVRGFTMWQDIAGRGSQTGEPHLGNHAWPTMNNAMLSIVPDDKVDDILAQLRAMDEETPDLGLRAFVWNVENTTDCGTIVVVNPVANLYICDWICCCHPERRAAKPKNL